MFLLTLMYAKPKNMPHRIVQKNIIGSVEMSTASIYSSLK
jgi:hypothetical protein